MLKRVRIKISTNNCVDGLYFFEFMSAVLLTLIGEVLYKRYVINAVDNLRVLLNQYKEGHNCVSLNKLYLHKLYETVMTR